MAHILIIMLNGIILVDGSLPPAETTTKGTRLTLTSTTVSTAPTTSDAITTLTSTASTSASRYIETTSISFSETTNQGLIFLIARNSIVVFYNLFW